MPSQNPQTASNEARGQTVVDTENNSAIAASWKRIASAPQTLTGASIAYGAIGLVVVAKPLTKVRRP